MSKTVYGEIDWNAGDVGGNRTKYLQMKNPGAYTIRVMGNPIQFYCHWLDTVDGKKKKVNSPSETPALVAKLEAAGFKRQTGWMVRVLDRSDGEFKLMEIGQQVYNGIRDLYNNKAWGKVTNYDLTITRRPKGSQPLYTVTPNPKEPLEAKFKDSFMEFEKNLDVDKLVAPTAVPKICELLGWKASEFLGAVEEEEDDAFGANSEEESSDDVDFSFD
jgi:hypothetical protein